MMIFFAKYLTGASDVKETESNGRNDKTTYEFFGFSYTNNGIICTTEVGQRIIDSKFDSEDFLKQILKLQYPNPIASNLKGFKENDYIFPLQIVIDALDKYSYLNRSELALLFGCVNYNEIDKVYRAIDTFREGYEQLPNKNENGKVKALCEEAFKHAYGALDNKIGSYYDYAEALSRCLIYTGIFSSSEIGRASCRKRV